MTFPTCNLKNVSEPNQRLVWGERSTYGKLHVLIRAHMRHAGPEIMLRSYAQVVTPEMQRVQVRWFESCGLGVGQNLLAQNAGSDAIQ